MAAPAGRGCSTATRYSGATSARMKSASRRKLTSTATTADAREVVEHARDGVVGQRGLPAVGDARPAQARRRAAGPACRSRSVAQVVDRRGAERVAVEDDGQARGAAVARDHHLRRGRGRLLARRRPPRRRRAGARRAPAGARAAPSRPATPGATTSTSVGETIPGAKPRLAASSALAHLVARRQRAHEAQPERGRARR